jgi:hypothetical protein
MLHIDQLTIHREGDLVIVTIPMTLKKRGGRKEIILPEGLVPEGSPAYRSAIQSPLVIALARAHRWKALIESGRYRTVGALARGLDPSYAGRILRLTLLAPDIVEAILAGREPSGVSLERLVRTVPDAWEEQRHVLGFAKG